MDSLDPSACYAALCARDARFDGHWFVGVRSTGVYCRPVCRVRTPKAENCRFYPLAAAAEAEGFRPCRKCRPELAPRAFSTAVATEQLAGAARERLDSGFGGSLAELAAQLGVSDRHLRRIFLRHWGVAPLQYQQTQRLLLAKRLLTDSRLEVAEVAARAGFGSTRAFHSAWSAHYRLAPLALRKAQDGAQGAARAEAGLLRLAWRPPLAAEALLRFLAARALPRVEAVSVEGLALRRSLRLADDCVGELALRFGERELQVRLSPALWRQPAQLLARLRDWLDLDADPSAIATHLGAAGLPLTPGLRLPGGVDRFELALRAVLGQQVTVAAARTLAGRLVEHWGEPLPAAARLEDDGLPAAERLSPTPAALAALQPEELAAAVRLPRQRARALVELARAWPQLSFAARRGTPEQAEAELRELPGIGPWTAAYLIMRGWPWPDRFPPGDVVLRQRLAARPQLDPAAFAPFRSYAVLQLWSLAE